MNKQSAIPVLPGNLRRFLVVLLVLTSLLIVDSAYLGSVTLIQWLTNEHLENQFFLSMFLVHLVLGFLLIIPAIVFMVLHLKKAITRPNRIAVRLGLGLLVSVLALIVSGVVLTRGLPFVEVKNPDTREIVYWIHIIAPIAIVWLFLLHRLAGPKIRWRAGAAVIGVCGLVSVFGVVLLQERPQAVSGVAKFTPALAKTVGNEYIPTNELMMDDYCAECHPDVHASWAVSAHRFASFNNPAYAFSVANTREKVLERDGDVTAARFCAGCHDPVPLFSGEFDDPNYDFVNSTSAHAGITCLSCHSIQEVGSTRGNADYLIDAPDHYPFAESQNAALRWLSDLLIKGKPSFHKSTMLKPFHKEAEFCGTCHKVHLPEQLNNYRWLRGQNHYDSYLLSGVSGHGVASFYYPESAVHTCNECHMKFVASNDFGAKPYLDDDGRLFVRDHQFPSANTALASLVDLPEESLDAHRRMLEGALRVDVFAVREGDELEQTPVGPLGETALKLNQETTYTVDVVLRTLTLGHLFTQGTSDSNEVWLDVSLSVDDTVIARSGSLDVDDGDVDENTHFVNAYILDRDGNQIALRNAEDIFTKLYDNQIAPGSASVVHYRFALPEHARGPVKITAKLKYRKFNTRYLKAIHGTDFDFNSLPITLIGEDSVVFQNAGNEPSVLNEIAAREEEVETWLRWNDYGIGWLNKPDKSGLRQAEFAFKKVVALGRAEGHLNLARTYLTEGRLEEADDELGLALQKGAYPWSVAWFGGLVDLQNGNLDLALQKFEGLRDTRFNEARERGFDFSKDYRLLNTLARTYFEKSKQESDENLRTRWLQRSASEYNATLAIDSENLTAHYGLAQTHALLGNDEESEYHQTQHEKYRVDDNARDRAVAAARRMDPAANHAADSIAIYSLRTPSIDIAE